MNVLNQAIGNGWALYHGDCCEVAKGLPDNSIDYTIFSPPFASLFTYSNSERDMGNSRSDSEFGKHFKFLAGELFRLTKPGRLVSIHCMDIPAMKERDGYIGLKDFPSELRATMESAVLDDDGNHIDGFIYHGKTIIWKDPLIEATRTKALGLMHKQIEKDSSRCRPGLPDYILTMRKPGENEDVIDHPGGLKCFYGDDEPKQTGIEYSHNVWRRYASPVWMDINQTRTLNVMMARDEKDERHICPLQLDTIARCLELWSKKNDVVFSPFAGIGSEGFESIRIGRRFIGIELKQSYFVEAVKNLEKAEKRQEQVKLFS